MYDTTTIRRTKQLRFGAVFGNERPLRCYDALLGVHEWATPHELSLAALSPPSIFTIVHTTCDSRVFRNGQSSPWVSYFSNYFGALYIV